jgi:hypothetical protein
MPKQLLLFLFALVYASTATAWSQGRIQVVTTGSQYHHTDPSQSVSHSNGPDGAVIERSSDTPLFETVIATEGTGMGSAYGFAGMLTSPGGVQVTVNGSVSAGPSSDFTAYANTDAVANATWSDAFVISVPSLPDGAPLTLTAHVFTNGTLLAQSFQTDSVGADWGSFVGPAGLASSNSSWEVTLRTTYAFETSATASAFCLDDRDDHNLCSAPVLGLDHEFFAINGSIVSLALEVEARAALGAQAFGTDGYAVTANADGMSDLGGLAPPGGSGSGAGAAAGWAGLSVTYQENPVDEFAATSAHSGFDYRNAYVATVPEASGAIPAAIAVLSVASRRRAGRRC